MASFDGAHWREVLADAPVTVLMGTLLRLVENQTQKVTAALVDNLDELDILEQLLDDSKPPLRPGTERFDYLLRAPWRYPPLPWGSRFGSRFAPSVFYGALDETSLLAEGAYYRLLFLAGMERSFEARVISQHTRFEARYHALRGLHLEHAPFVDYRPTLRHRTNYGPCQVLGGVLREQGIGAFTYLSARAPDEHLNIALLEPECLVSNRHRRPIHGLCETRAQGVQYRFEGVVHWFARERFLVDGKLPLPAT